MNLSIYLYLAELLGLGMLLIQLHRVSERYGIAAFLFVLASVVSVLQGPGTSVVYVETEFVRLMISPAVLVPCVLMSILLVYIVDGTATARLVIFGVLLTSFATLLGTRMLATHLELPGSGTVMGDKELLLQFKPSFLLIGSSLAALLVSTMVMLVSYQFIRNLLPEKFRWVSHGLALVIGLATDGLVFSMLFMGNVGASELMNTKIMSAVLLWPLMSLYLIKREALADRRPMDVLFGSYGRQDLRLRRAEEATRVAQQRLETVVGNTPLILFSVDSRGCFSWVEGAGLETISLKREEIVRKRVDAIFEGAGPLVSAALLGEERDGVVNVQDQEFELCLRPQWDADGVLVEVNAVATDVTARKATERELVEAQKLKVLGQLTGGVAHDFNNLLMIVMGGLELAMKETLDEKLHQILDPAFNATKRGAVLTQQLLAYSRNQPLRAESLDVQPLLEELQSMLSRTLPEDITIELAVDPEVANCIADGAQLQNAIINLALNAKDAMNAGGNLVLSAYEIDQVSDPELELQSGKYVVVEVVDNGCGMPPKILERIYEPFFTTKDVGAGSGLGLSMVYGFAKQSDGTVKVDSMEGEGTRVQLYLPADSGELVQAPAMLESHSAPMGNGELIMLVEDDVEVSDLVCLQLASLNYRTKAVNTGKEGIALLAKGERPDLLITDVVLPGGLDGTEVAEKALELVPDLPVVFVSGYSRGALIDQNKLSPQMVLLSKPFNLEQVGDTVFRTLHGREAV